MLKGKDYKKTLEQIKKLEKDLDKIQRQIFIIKINTILKLKKKHNIYNGL